MKIAIRAGHQPSCQGAIGILNEVKETRKYYKRVMELLQENGQEVHEVTPEDDTNSKRELTKGVQATNNLNVDLFISCHLNKAYNSYNGAIGAEAELYSDSGLAGEVAHRILNNLEKVGFKNRGVKIRHNLYELSATNCPAIILEPFFLEATRDVEIYQNNFEEMCVAIAEGILGYEINHINNNSNNDNSNNDSNYKIYPQTNSPYVEECKQLLWELGYRGFAIHDWYELDSNFQGSLCDIQNKIFGDGDGIINSITIQKLKELVEENKRNELEQQNTQIKELYRIRLTWEDSKTQLGAFEILDNAIEKVKQNPTYKAFNNNGEIVFEIKEEPIIEIPIEENPKDIILENPTIKTAIIGSPICTVEQCETYLHCNNIEAPFYAEKYKQLAEIEGVRFDILFAQSLLETNYFRFGGDVKPEQNNFSGLGAVGNGECGLSFNTIENGIKCQVQHMKGYATTDILNEICIDARYNYIQPHGKAPNIEDLGNGNWASDVNYGEKILNILESIKQTVPIDDFCKPKEKPIIQEPINDNNDNIIIDNNSRDNIDNKTPINTPKESFIFKMIDTIKNFLKKIFK